MLARTLEHASLFTQASRSPRNVARPAADRLKDIPQAFVTRRASRSRMATLTTGQARPACGDLVLVRVRAVGRFCRVELASSTVSAIHAGDELIACFAGVHGDHGADRGELCLDNPAGIVSPGVHRYHDETLVELIGSINDANGAPLNLAEWAAPSAMGRLIHQPVIALVGERHLPGEPCRAADLVRGLSSSGFNVGAANITGVPGCWKTRLLGNAGASLVLDIADAGRVTTAGQGAGVIEEIFLSLIGQLAASGVDVMVLEIEKDVFDHDAAALITLPSFQGRVSTVILEGRDGTVSELERDSLRAMGFDVTLVDEPGHKPRYQRLI